MWTPTHTTCTDERSVSAHHTAQSDHFITRTRVAQRPNRSRLQALVRLKIVCHPRVMSRFFCRTWHHKHKFFLNHHSNHTFICFYPAKIHDKMAEPRHSHLPLVTSARELSSTGILRSSRSNARQNCGSYQNLFAEDMDEFGKFGVKLSSYNQSQIHSDNMTQQKALPTRTSEMDNFGECWLHRCRYGGEKTTLILLKNQ